MKIRNDHRLIKLKNMFIRLAKDKRFSYNAEVKIFAIELREKMLQDLNDINFIINQLDTSKR